MKERPDVLSAEIPEGEKITIERAIEILKSVEVGLPLITITDLGKAIGLGIQALGNGQLLIQQAKAEVAREIKKQLRVEHKSLEELSRVCFIFLRRLDEVMADAKGNPLEAGKTIAALANRLEMANDEVRYFNLGVDYRKDDKDKVWQSLKDKYLKEAA